MIGWIFAALALILAVTMEIIFPISRGIVKPFKDEHGEIIPGSISEKTFIDVNGQRQGMFIRGIDQTNPVLLLLHGGPGLSDYFLSQSYPTALEESFVVCFWEQPGTGLSYSSALVADEMTTERLIQDTVEVTRYLSERFSQDKIYLMGHSFGSYLGLKTVSQYPELYQAYIAMSQITNQLQSEKDAYMYMLTQYQNQANQKMIDQFSRYPILDSEEALDLYLNSGLRDKAMHELGIGTTHDMRSVVTGLFFPSLRCLDYTQAERIQIWQGNVFSRQTHLMDEVYAFNAFTDIPQIEVPIYFFAGIYDYTVTYALQRAYFEAIEAPIKGFYTFHNSAHSPIFEEPDVAKEIINSDLFHLKTDLQDPL